MGEKDTIAPRSVSLEYIIFMANGTSPSETIPPTIRPLGIPITAVLNILRTHDPLDFVFFVVPIVFKLSHRICVSL